MYQHTVAMNKMTTVAKNASSPTGFFFFSRMRLWGNARRLNRNTKLCILIF